MVLVGLDSLMCVRFSHFSQLKVFQRVVHLEISIVDRGQETLRFLSEAGALDPGLPLLCALEMKNLS